MIKGVYDSIAERWYRGGTIYFYSDPHFSDEEMWKVRTSQREDLKNLSLKEFDEFQIKSINAKVGKKDTIVFLGDIGNLECVKKIRGYKVLIMGNHDMGSSNYKRVRNDIKYFSISIDKPETVVKTEDNHLFDEVKEGRYTISDKIILSHEPYDDPYAFNIHGHDHSGKTFNDNKHLNVCAEIINYTPVPIGDVIKSGKLKNIVNIHREAIDKQISEKLKRNNSLSN